MKILITGNMGYVGPVMVEHLRAAFPDAELVGFDAGFFGSAITGVDVLPESRLDQQIFGDVRDFDPVHLRGVDHVIHLAAISNDPISDLYERVTYEINHLGTIRVARAAREAGVKSFVFASSCSMYGSAEDGPRTEKSALNPLTPYAKSKVLAERDLEPLADEDFQITSLRYSTACGMSPRLRLDLVLNDFVACAVAGKPVSVLSDGTPWRPLINVGDMARAARWAIHRESAGADFLAVNVGSEGWNTQVRDLANAVGEMIEGAEVSINKSAPPDGRSYRVDFGLFTGLAPDHLPLVSLADTIQQLRDGLIGMGFSDGEFRRSGLMRINHLTRLREQGLLDDDLRWTRSEPAVVS